MKTIFCPIHQVPLKIGKKTFETLGVSAFVGKCPKCRDIYISRNFFQGSSKMNIAGVKYQFLQELHDYEWLKNEEKKKALEELRQKQEAISKEEEKRVKQLKEAKRRRRQQKKAEEQWRLAAEQQKNKEQREAIERNPNREIIANRVCYYNQKPLVCPHDNWPLVLANQIKCRGKKEKGLFCTHCRRAYFPIETEKKQAEKEQIYFAGHKQNTGMNEELQHLENMPKSIVLEASIRPLLCNKLKTSERVVIIVGDQRDQNSEQGIYWIGRKFPSLIMAALLTNPQHQFELQNIKYCISNYKMYPSTKEYLDIFSRFYNPSTPQTIYVFSHKNISAFSGNEYENVTAMVPCADSEYPVPIEVYYEKRTHRYFINDTSYQVARMRYGLPYLRVRLDTASQGTRGQYDGCFNAHSELFLLGYTVSASDGLTSQQRKKLLSDIINSGILSKAEVMNHIEWLIHTRSGIHRMDNAVQEWRSDLMYVSHIGVNHERTIFAKDFMRK